GLTNVPMSNSGNPPLAIQPDWELIIDVQVNSPVWMQAMVFDVAPQDPVNNQLLLLDVPAGNLDVRADEVFLGLPGPQPDIIGFSVSCIGQEGTEFTFQADIANPPFGFNPGPFEWDFGDGGL